MVLWLCLLRLLAWIELKLCIIACTTELSRALMMLWLVNLVSTATMLLAALVPIGAIVVNVQIFHSLVHSAESRYISTVLIDATLGLTVSGRDDFWLAILMINALLVARCLHGTVYLGLSIPSFLVV